MIRPASAFVLLATLASSCKASTDEAPPRAADVVKWTATARPAEKSPDGGSAVTIDLTGNVKAGWHIYSLTQSTGGPMPMTVKLADGSPFTIEGPVVGPPPQSAMDNNFGVATEKYSGQPGFRVTVKLPVAADSVRTIELKVRSQACSDKLCLPARTENVSVSMSGSRT